jgi:hypothetical protein
MARFHIKITRKLRKINGLSPVFYEEKDFIRLPENPRLSSLGMNGARSEAEVIRRSRGAREKPWPLGQGVSFWDLLKANPMLGCLILQNLDAIAPKNLF